LELLPAAPRERMRTAASASLTLVSQVRILPRALAAVAAYVPATPIGPNILKSSGFV
jgi:hypothetical protein